MKQAIVFTSILLISIKASAQFPSTSQNWTIPAMENSGSNLDQVSGANYSLVDINGDGFPDLVDAQDQNSGSVWVSGNPYWKVYLNGGTSFNSTAQNWTIPAMENSGSNLDQVSGANYSLVDINGDGKPDLVDAQDQNSGSVWVSGNPYWKVYLNNGTSFSTTAQNWTIPAMESSGSNLDQVSGANYSLVDINGDGLPDLVDAQDQNSGSVWVSGNPYWKVYLNNGTSFNTTAQNWTIPAMESSGSNLDQVSGANYSLVDIDGDGKPDLVDAQDQNSGSVWVSGNPYWKVYLNSGTSFNTTAQNWTIPAMESSGSNLDQVSGANYSLVDINGDGKPDLVDAQDQNSGSVWVSGNPYWKVYLNGGTSFNTTAQNWTIPAMENSGSNLDQVSAANYSLVDINGDGNPDLVDAQDQNSGSVWVSGNPYWKVYTSTADIQEVIFDSNLLKIYPNPTSGQLSVDLDGSFGDFDLKVINNLGLVVYETKGSNVSHIDCNVENFEAGLYFVTLVNESKTYTSKVIKK
jgi:hypothetical protein